MIFREVLKLREGGLFKKLNFIQFFKIEDFSIFTQLLIFPLCKVGKFLLKSSQGLTSEEHF